MLQGEHYGVLEFIGKQQESETLLTLAQLTELLDSLHSQLEAFVGDFKENNTNPDSLDDSFDHQLGNRKSVENLSFLQNSAAAVTNRVTGAVDFP
jgi:hypothetical protein